MEYNYKGFDINKKKKTNTKSSNFLVLNLDIF